VITASSLADVVPRLKGADPYKEYLQPWFGTHIVLGGGAWSTRARMITTRWPNFYRPGRRDIITGFRTCKIA
jgi:gamma-glutamyl hercynylcysteine S-oxide synthase